MHSFIYEMTIYTKQIVDNFTIIIKVISIICAVFACCWLLCAIFQYHLKSVFIRFLQRLLRNQPEEYFTYLPPVYAAMV